jgi:hypothetical protein
LILETSAGVRITVWRPYQPDRPLTLQLGDSETVTAVHNGVRLQQEAYAWQVREDIWGGLIDAELRETLSQRFIRDFEPVLLPDRRSMDKLKLLLDDIAAAIPNAEWSTSGQQLEEDGETAFRLNALLAFYAQLSWIYEVFRDTPGESISVR